jgi:hypothetical protein
MVKMVKMVAYENGTAVELCGGCLRSPEDSSVRTRPGRAGPGRAGPGRFNAGQLPPGMCVRERERAGEREKMCEGASQREMM